MLGKFLTQQFFVAFYFAILFNLTFYAHLAANDTIIVKNDELKKDSIYLKQLIVYLKNNQHSDSVVTVIAEATSILCKTNKKNVIALADDLANLLKSMGNFQSAYQVKSCEAYFYEKAGQILKKLEVSNYAAYLKSKCGDFNESSEILFNNLKEAEENNLSAIVSEIYMYLGFNIRYSNVEKALSYFQKCVENNPDTLSRNYHVSINEIGNAYSELGNIEQALEYHKQAIELRKKLDKSLYLAYSYHDISLDYFRISEYKTALDYIYRCFNLLKENNDITSLATAYSTIVQQLVLINDFSRAEFYLNEMYKIVASIENSFVQNLYYEVAYLYYKSINDEKNALRYLELFKALNDSLEIKNIDKQIEELHIKNEIENKQEQINLQQTVIEKKNLQRNIALIITVFSLFVILLILRNYYLKQKSNRIISEKNKVLELANEEIALQHKEVMEQNKIISRQSKRITDSIEYAKFIQRAMITGEKTLESNVSESFIFYRPKDIVSGDFYWIKKIKNNLLVAAVDCTGHGVPGAFMSVLGITFLNEITISNPDLNVAEILNLLRNKVKESLHQNDVRTISTDGMDLSIISINLETHDLNFAGANLPLFAILKLNNQLQEIKPDFMPVGVFVKEKSFTRKQLKLQKNDLLYLFTDGYIDQFGGDDNKKFMSSNFKELIMEIKDFPMNEQKAAFEKSFVNHKGENEQTDDILIIGIKV